MLQRAMASSAVEEAAVVADFLHFNARKAFLIVRLDGVKHSFRFLRAKAALLLPAPQQHAGQNVIPRFLRHRREQFCLWIMIIASGEVLD